MLPAAIDDSTALGKGRVHKCIGNAVYRGYLVFRSDRYWIAPLAYYEARQQAIAKQQANRAERGNKIHRAADKFFDAQAAAQAMTKGMVIGAIVGVIVGFAAGVMIGMTL